MSRAIKEILMDRDNRTAEEAEEIIKSARASLRDRLRDPETYGDPEDICEDFFDLELDYVAELII